eukprot:CAMPEP_0204838712 /NCGR_PEP_ID=MMETSP1346-20131115/31671_1 /ASSEMBLY_ACC=CAM_ASM_000771 /TAXON_ID=215587 /ORGANISM="Aplanochytrium stocchinoi, Strain GSBS06" /LENGTH=40 /DNA_ID= /DNA_START= /DNA_END= /DNA_ORIENTATION=
MEWAEKKEDVKGRGIRNQVHQPPELENILTAFKSISCRLN